MITTRQKVSFGLMFVGIALGTTAGTLALPKPEGEDHVIWHDNAGVRHPDGDLRGVVERRTTLWMGVAAAVLFVAGAAVRER